MRAQYCTSIVAFLQIIEPSHHLKDLQLWRAVYMYKTPPSASLDEAQLDADPANATAGMPSATAADAGGAPGLIKTRSCDNLSAVGINATSDDVSPTTSSANRRLSDPSVLVSLDPNATAATATAPAAAAATSSTEVTADDNTEQTNDAIVTQPCVADTAAVVTNGGDVVEANGSMMPNGDCASELADEVRPPNNDGERKAGDMSTSEGDAADNDASFLVEKHPQEQQQQQQQQQHIDDGIGSIHDDDDDDASGSQATSTVSASADIPAVHGGGAMAESGEDARTLCGSFTDSTSTIGSMSAPAVTAGGGSDGGARAPSIEVAEDAAAAAHMSVSDNGEITDDNTQAPVQLSCDTQTANNCSKQEAANISNTLMMSDDNGVTSQNVCSNDVTARQSCDSRAAGVSAATSTANGHVVWPTENHSASVAKIHHQHRSASQTNTTGQASVKRGQRLLPNSEHNNSAEPALLELSRPATTTAVTAMSNGCSDHVIGGATAAATGARRHFQTSGIGYTSDDLGGAKSCAALLAASSAAAPAPSCKKTASAATSPLATQSANNIVQLQRAASVSTSTSDLSDSNVNHHHHVMGTGSAGRTHAIKSTNHLMTQLVKANTLKEEDAALLKQIELSSSPTDAPLAANGIHPAATALNHKASRRLHIDVSLSAASLNGGAAAGSGSVAATGSGSRLAREMSRDSCYSAGSSQHVSGTSSYSSTPSPSMEKVSLA